MALVYSSDRIRTDLQAWMILMSKLENGTVTLKCRKHPRSFKTTDSLGHVVFIKDAFRRAKFLYHISHALQSLLSDFCGIITVNLYSRTETYKNGPITTTYSE